MIKKYLASKTIFGKNLDPLKADTKSHIALATFMAWVGLGADGISSACYGPEEAFKALAHHTPLAIFLAMATVVTVFLIAIAYMQVIELFPGGGGGYKVATNLLGPKAGLVSGSALIIDYVLTIAISVAAGVDSLFSLINSSWQPYKIFFEILMILMLAYLNLRGMKESIKILLPIFIGFLVTHAALIIYGIFAHHHGLANIIPAAIEDTANTAESIGIFALLAILFKAFSMGGGTYTGLEAISNNTQALAEPRIRTGKNTMIATAFSLSIMAAGIIITYLLWDVSHVDGKTFNAVAFEKITAGWTLLGFEISKIVVGITMFFAAGILLVAANSGFLAGPSVLANMAVDRWMPSFFSALSSRLVTKNGVTVMAISAIVALLITGGKVSVLVVLYSINVFLTFSLSMIGVSKLRIKQRNWRKILPPLLASIVCVGILITTVIEKFSHGGWITIIITGLVIKLGLLIKRHYTKVQDQVAKMEEHTARILDIATGGNPEIDVSKPTAAIIINDTMASGLHVVNWVQKTFPNIFHNFVFLGIGEIDNEEFIDEEKLTRMKQDTKQNLDKYVAFCKSKGLPASSYISYGTDELHELTFLTLRATKKYPNVVFFSAKVVSDNENVFTIYLHNRTNYILQRRLHNRGDNLIIVPLKLT
jgi:amino acid transporter